MDSCPQGVEKSVHLSSTTRISQTDASLSLSLAGRPMVGPDVAIGHSFSYKFIGFKRSGSVVVKVLQTSKNLLWKMENQLHWEMPEPEPGGSQLHPKPAVGIKAHTGASPKFCLNLGNGCKNRGCPMASPNG